MGGRITVGRGSDALIPTLIALVSDAEEAAAGVDPTAAQEVRGRGGIKNAVPKTIMQLMIVENVASHLQKYRLYLTTSPRALRPLHALRALYPLRPTIRQLQPSNPDDDASKILTLFPTADY